MNCQKLLNTPETSGKLPKASTSALKLPRYFQNYEKPLNTIKNQPKCVRESFNWPGPLKNVLKLGEASTSALRLPRYFQNCRKALNTTENHPKCVRESFNCPEPLKNVLKLPEHLNTFENLSRSQKKEICALFT